MKKLLLLFAIPILLGATAFAGQRSAVNVWITGNTVMGSVTAAHNSADGNQRIACAGFTYPNAHNIAMCTATTASNEFAFCFSDEPAMVNAALSVNNTSLIYFTFDKTGHCTELSVHNDSMHYGKGHQ